MSQFSHSETVVFFSLFGLSLAITIGVWFLRGLQVLPSMTSGLIWVLLLLSISLGAIGLFSYTKRY